MKRTGKNLNDMLTLARENQPTQNLFSPEDLQGIIGQAQDNPSTPVNGGNRSFPSGAHYRNRIITISVAGLLLAGASFLYFGEPASTARELPRPAIAGRTEVKPAPSSDLSDSNGDPSPAGREENNGKENRGDLLPRSPGETKPVKKDEASDADIIAGIIINDLTPEEMERIFGIHFSEGKAEILIEQVVERNTLEPEQLDMLAKYGYDITAPEIRIRSEAFVNAQPNSIRGNTGLVPPQPDPLLTSPVGLVLFETESPDGLIMSFGDKKQLAGVGTWDDQLSEEIAALSETKGRIRPESVLSRLVAVRVPSSYRSDKGEEIRRDLYVWYIPTPQLLEALPQRYRTPGLQALAQAKYSEPVGPTSRKPLVPGVLRYTRHSPEYGDTSRYYNKDLTRFDGHRDIGGIRFFELERVELERLGIGFSESGVIFTMQQQFRAADPGTSKALEELGYDLNQPMANVGFQITADTFEMKFKELPNADFTPTSIAPVLYSGRWIKPEGQEGLSMIFTTRSPLLDQLGATAKDLCDEVSTAYDSDADQNELTYRALNELIPIRIRLESDELIERAGRNRGAEILLWYVPTPEFVSALPNRYRIPLEKELKLMASVEEGNIPAGEACKRMAGETVIMDFCRSGSGVISYTRAWPNPAKEEITLNYVLTAPRQVAITMHDLSGKFLGELTAYAAQSAGQHQVNVNLDEINVNSGTYLVTVRTDRGEQAVQRIIVR